MISEGIHKRNTVVHIQGITWWWAPPSSSLVMAELGRMLEDLVDEPELQRLLRAHELVPVQRGLDQIVGSPFKGIVSRDE
jgi:hypothetical protein